MSDSSINVIGLQDLQANFPRSIGDLFSDNFFLANMHYYDAPELLELFRKPCRLDGYMGIFCFEGELSVEINLKTYQIKERSVIINVPGNIWRVNSIQPRQLRKLRLALVAISRDFMSISRMNYIQLYKRSLSVFDNPCFSITEKEQAMLNKYYDLAHNLLLSCTGNIRAVLWGLISSCLFYFGRIWTEKIAAAENVVQVPATTEKRTRHYQLLLERFLDLVSEYHYRERRMAFYADKLCLTPKYLSRIIKNVSGRPGPDWIDSFVLLDAKNMLKYTKTPIKQIVSRLNFSSPSVFYKYFKTHTGLTPSEYRG